MDRLHSLIVIGLFVLFSGCVIARPLSNGVLHSDSANNASLQSQSSCYQEQENRTVICDSVRGYTYWQPKWIAETDWHSRGLSISTYDFPLSVEEQKEWKSYGHDLPLLASCSPSLTGTSKTTLLTNANGKAEWGRADYWDGHRNEGWEYDQWQNVICTYDGIPEPVSVYAMCSDKDGKTVVICINQQTDNPDLAEQIFETFRWTK